MKGLKKDHDRLTELMFSHLHTLHQNMVHTLHTLPTSAYLSSLLHTYSKINITEKYLLALSTHERDLLPQIHTLVTTLTSLYTSTIPLLPAHTETPVVVERMMAIMSRFMAFLGDCDSMTMFNASPYSGADVMVVGFDQYDEEYDSLLEEMYDYGMVLDDWTEGLLKGDWDGKDHKSGVKGQVMEEDAMFVVDGVEEFQQCPNFGIGVF